MAHGGSLARTHEGVPGLPRGRSRLPADEVLAAQRERLLRAMIASVAEHGYGAVTVAQVVSRARVSRSAFYAHFAGKEECFFAAASHGSAMLFDSTIASVKELDTSASPEQLLRVGLRGFLRFLHEEPAFARVFYVDLAAAGVRAEERLAAAYDRWAELNHVWHERARMREPSWPQVPREAYLALAGATGELVRELVRANQLDRLPELEEPLVNLHLSVLAGRRWPSAEPVEEPAHRDELLSEPA